MLRGHFWGFAWGIIDGDLGCRSVFEGFLWSALFAFRGFKLDRNGFCRRQFFSLCIDKFLDLFCLAEQFLVDLREALLVLFELSS